MKELRSSIEIDATPERIWDVLMDFEAYPEWNPFVTSIEGEPTVGSRLSIYLEPPEGKAMGIKPKVRRVEAHREFRWLGRLGPPRIFDGEHIFELTPTEAGRTRLVHREEFRGVLISPLLAWVGKSTLAGFEAMNHALKQRAEAPVAAAS